MTALQRVSAKNLNVSFVNEILERDGCIVITDVVTPDTSKKLKDEMNDALQEVPFCQGNFFGFATKRFSSVLAKSAVSRDLTVAPAILKVMDEFLLRNCRQYQLNLTQAIQIFPGEPAQIIHTDDLMFPFEMAKTGEQKMINCMWAVDDFTIENGATNLVPGSHKWPRDRQPQPEEIVYGEMPAGSVLIYFGSLLHCGGANKSNRSRTGLVLSYCLGWLRQAENHYLALPADLVRTFSPELQRLVGYFVHEPNLGALNGRDPVELLQTAEGLSSTRFEEFIPKEVQGLIEEYRRNAA